MFLFVVRLGAGTRFREERGTCRTNQAQHGEGEESSSWIDEVLKRRVFLFKNGKVYQDIDVGRDECSKIGDGGADAETDVSILDGKEFHAVDKTTLEGGGYAELGQ